MHTSPAGPCLAWDEKTQGLSGHRGRQVPTHQPPSRLSREPWGAAHWVPLVEGNTSSQLGARLCKSKAFPIPNQPQRWHTKAEREGALSSILLKEAHFLQPQPKPVEVNERLFIAFSRLSSKPFSAGNSSMCAVVPAIAVITHAQWKEG